MMGRSLQPLLALLLAGCAARLDTLYGSERCSEALPFDAGFGAVCFSNEDCPAEQYCAGIGCGTQGFCERRCPTSFTSGVQFVCGCDGRTYTDPDSLALEGVRLAAVGVCGAPPGSGPRDSGTGTCRSHADCPSGWFCDRHNCSDLGVCAFLPTACADEVRPVCGCDGRLYQNACAAVQSGVDYTEVFSPPCPVFRTP